MKNPLLDRDVLPEDLEYGAAAADRPDWLSEYVGQTGVKERLSIFVEAARARRDALDHVLLSGPPGLGKTTLAHIIAHEMGTKIHTVTGPAIEKKGDLAAILNALAPGDVLFIDEIHRLNRTLEEVLYPAMEDFKLDIIAGTGPTAQTFTFELPPFTLVGATTRSGLLSNPLRDRFGVQLRLDFYPAHELERIVEGSAQKMGMSLESGASAEIAKRSRGTPRIAKRLLKRVRDIVEVRAKRQGQAPRMNQEAVSLALDLCEVDHRGLDQMDRRLLEALIDKYDGGPVGIENLSAALGEERDTLDEVYEPYLIQEGFVQRTPRGRMATRLAYEHLGREFPVVVPRAETDLEQ